MSEISVIVNNQPLVIEVVTTGTGEAVAAASVPIEDAGDYYASGNVEGALQEAGATNEAQQSSIDSNSSAITTNATAINTKVDTAGRMLDKTGTTFDVKEDFNSKQYDSAYQTLTFSASVAWNMSLGQGASITVTGDCTIQNPTNSNSITPVLEVIQDATGGHGVSFGSDFVAIDDSQVTTGANSITFYAFLKGSDGKYRGQGKTFAL